MRRVRNSGGPRARTRLSRCVLLALAALAIPLVARGAAFTPGQAPITTDLQGGGSESNGNGNGSSGFQLMLAPIRYWGLASLDYRYRDIAGDTSHGEVFTTTVNGATYVWQPWFLQVNGSVGVVGSVDSSEQSSTARNVSGIGTLDLALFPMSRFPFSLYVDVGDSRARAEVTDIDYRTYRLRVAQSYAPAVGGERYYGSFEQSTLRSLTSDALAPASVLPEAEDTLQILRLGASKVWQQQSLEGEVSVSRNHREEGDVVQQTSIDVANIRHLFNPRQDFSMSSGLSYTKTAVEAPRPLTIPTEVLPGAKSSSTFSQLISYAAFRPVPGGPFYREGGSVLGSATFRAFDFSNEVDSAETGARGAAASLGLTYTLSPRLQAYSNTQAGFSSGSSEDTSVVAQTLGVAYTPDAILLNDIRYAWSLSGAGTLGVQTGGQDDGANYIANASAGHSFNRSFGLSRTDALNLTFAQGVTLSESSLEGTAATLTNSLSAFWNGPATANSQAYAGFNLSDARRFGDRSGYFQLVNLQGNFQWSLSRWSFLSGGITLQASRFHEERTDDFPFSPFLRANEDDWRVTYGASLLYTHSRAFGVPRLLYTALLEGSSFDYDSRALGTIDGPLVQVDWRVEHRLEYRIGKLALLGTVRWAELQNRGSSFQAFVRAERQFGGL